MSSAAVLYQSNFDDVLDTAFTVKEVDGIPVYMGDEELTRIGMFSIKEDRAEGGDAYRSDDVEMNSWIRDFEHHADMDPGSFDSYDTARFWSHP